MSKKRFFCCLLWVSFCFFMIWMTILKRDVTEREYEIGLFWGLRMWLNNEPYGYEVFIQYVYNIIFFIPFGYLLCETVDLRWKTVLIVGLVVSASIELIQFITARGLAEIDDIISNTTGAMMGFLLWKARIKIVERCVNVR